MTAPPKKKYVPKKQACEHVGISTRTMDRYIQLGLVRAYRVGPKLIRLDLDEVEKALIGDR